MTQLVINIGTVPNDGDGDPLRTAFQKVNNNFTQLFTTGVFTTETYTFDDSSNQVIFETAANLFTQGNFQINSSNPDTEDSQNISLTVSISSDLTSVQWVGFNSLVFNDPVTTYDVDIDSGNVRILASPLIDTTLFHFIAAQITFSENIPGTPLELEGTSGNILGTENLLPITTETP